MNTLKPLLFIAILAGIGYGVYSRLNNEPESPPPDASSGWEAGAQVQMPGEGSDGAPPWASPAGQSPAGVAGTLSPPPGVSTPASSPPSFSSHAGTPVERSSQGPGGFELPPNQTDPPAAYDPRAVDSRTVDPRAVDPRIADARSIDPNGADSRYADARGAAPPFSGRDVMPRQSLTQAGDAAPGAGGFASSLEAARRQLDDGHLVEGLQQLSQWYDDPRLSPIEQEELMHLLDQVSGTVIYSTRSLLEDPYEVVPGERLDDIAQKYNVPAQLLAKINGIENPNDLRPGERLKVVRGPFNAVVSLDKKRITLMLGGSYAGHFDIGLGREYPASEGQFVVTDKLINPTYHGLERAIDADDPANPLGERWIGLGDRLSIHSTNNPSSIGKSDLPGCISLKPRDAEDVFDILSEGSKVVIRR